MIVDRLDRWPRAASRKRAASIAAPQLLDLVAVDRCLPTQILKPLYSAGLWLPVTWMPPSSVEVKSEK